MRGWKDSLRRGPANGATIGRRESVAGDGVTAAAALYVGFLFANWPTSSLRYITL